MFGFRKAKIQAAASDQIGGCIVRARDFDMVLRSERRDLDDVVAAMPAFQPGPALRLLTVAQLAHNLLGLLLVYRAINEAGIDGEYLPTVDAIFQILGKKPDFGHVAVAELGDLLESGEENIGRSKLARRGWGAWVVTNLKRESSGQSKSASASLDARDDLLADAIDDYIVMPFLEKFDVFYRK